MKIGRNTMLHTFKQRYTETNEMSSYTTKPQSFSLEYVVTKLIEICVRGSELRKELLRASAKGISERL